MDLRQQLIDGDPIAREPELDARHAQTMRQRVMLEARKTFSPSRAWLQPIAVAGALAACLVAGIGIGVRLNEPQPLAPAPIAQPAIRQMQFAAPGGTRIIWTFQQELDL